MEFGGEDPLKEYFSLLRRAIGIHLNEASSRGKSLYLSNGTNRIRPFKVMDRIDRQNCVEALVGKRQFICAAELQTAHHLWLAMPQGILGNIETKRFEARANLHEILDQKPLGAADIQHPIAGRKVKVFDDDLSDRNPAAIITIATITISPWPIEIQFPVLPRNSDDLW